MTEPTPDYMPDPAQPAHIHPAFLKVLSALPPAYCRPTVLLEVQNAIEASLGPKP